MDKPSSRFLGYGSPERLEEAIKASEASDDTFTIYTEGLIYASVCSSLPLDEVKLRMKRVISGITNGWTLAEKEKFRTGENNPCPCNLKPKTHKHYLFEC